MECNDKGLNENPRFQKSENHQKSEIFHLKNFQTHMYDFVFDNSFVALNYKYYEVPSSAKTFSNSYYSSRFREKECPPQIGVDLGGALVQMSIWKGFVVKRIWFLKLLSFSDRRDE